MSQASPRAKVLASTAPAIVGPPVWRTTKDKNKGAADRHIGCAQLGRPSTGGGGKGWPVRHNKARRRSLFRADARMSVVHFLAGPRPAASSPSRPSENIEPQGTTSPLTTLRRRCRIGSGGLWRCVYAGDRCDDRPGVFGDAPMARLVILRLYPRVMGAL